MKKSINSISLYNYRPDDISFYLFVIFKLFLCLLFKLLLSNPLLFCSILFGKVRILKERILPDFLDGARPPSHCKFCCSPTEQDSIVQTAVDRQGNVIASVSKMNNRQVIWIHKIPDIKYKQDNANVSMSVFALIFIIFTCPNPVLLSPGLRASGLA